MLQSKEQLYDSEPFAWEELAVGIPLERAKLKPKDRNQLLAVLFGLPLLLILLAFSMLAQDYPRAIFEPIGRISFLFVILVPVLAVFVGLANRIRVTLYKDRIEWSRWKRQHAVAYDDLKRIEVGKDQEGQNVIIALFDKNIQRPLIRLVGFRDQEAVVNVLQRLSPSATYDEKQLAQFGFTRNAFLLAGIVFAVAVLLSVSLLNAYLLAQMVAFAHGAWNINFTEPKRSKWPLRVLGLFLVIVMLFVAVVDTDGFHRSFQHACGNIQRVVLQSGCVREYEYTPVLYLDGQTDSPLLMMRRDELRFAPVVPSLLRIESLPLLSTTDSRPDVAVATEDGMSLYVAERTTIAEYSLIEMALQRELVLSANVYSNELSVSDDGAWLLRGKDYLIDTDSWEAVPLDVSAAALNELNNQLLFVKDGATYTYQLPSFEAKLSPLQFEHSVTGMSFSQDGSLLAVCEDVGMRGGTDQIRLFDTQTFEVRGMIRLALNNRCLFEISADNTLLAAEFGNKITVWNITGEPVLTHSFDVGYGYFEGLSFSADSQYLAVREPFEGYIFRLD